MWLFQVFPFLACFLHSQAWAFYLGERQARFSGCHRERKGGEEGGGKERASDEMKQDEKEKLK